MPHPLDDFRECWFLTGATASGKTAVAVELAERIGAEIISMDSMALYRRMDIGTAKPTPEQRERARHHLVGYLEPWQEFSVAAYRDVASAAVREIRSRGAEVLFTGGTPLYLKSLLRGIFRGPAADWDLRKRLLEEADRRGPVALHARLAAADPVAAARLHPNDVRRVVRALEVFEQTGERLSKHQQQFRNPNHDAAGRVFCLELPRRLLYDRIDERVAAMFDAGLVAEVEGMLRLRRPLSRTARQALGYKEVIEHLEGRRGLGETVALVQRRTRRFAKHQRTWFRSLDECRPVAMTGAESAAEMAGCIEAWIRAVSKSSACRDG